MFKQKIFFIFLIIGCSRYAPVSKTNIRLNTQALTASEILFLSGIAVNNSGNHETIWVDKIDAGVKNFEKELKVGKWIFFGRGISNGKEVCAYQQTDLKAEIETVEINFSSSACDDKKLSSSTNKEINLYVCNDLKNIDKNGCNGYESAVKSIQVNYLTVHSSSITSPEITTNKPINL